MAALGRCIIVSCDSSLAGRLRSVPLSPPPPLNSQLRPEPRSIKRCGPRATQRAEDVNPTNLHREPRTVPLRRGAAPAPVGVSNRRCRLHSRTRFGFAQLLAWCEQCTAVVGGRWFVLVGGWSAGGWWVVVCCGWWVIGGRWLMMVGGWTAAGG